MLNVNRLRILIEVASRGSFSAAADALSYTQASVSQQIAALEHETGVTLLERDRSRRPGSKTRRQSCSPYRVPSRSLAPNSMRAEV